MSENNSNSEWSKRELGALWKRQGKSQNYLSGFIKVGEFGVEQEVRVVIFTNKHKSKNEKAPDFVVYLSEEPQKQANASNEDAKDNASASEEVPEILR